jgi:RNA polymerase sigma-70 factor, ECF subfamily
MQRLEAFEEQRPFLFGLAYRMLGTRTEAEDVVQESFLRWQGATDSEINSAKAYLATVVTRLSIDTLRSAQHKREQYTGPWLPEPLLDPAPDPVELAESLSMAFLLMLESLSPVERAVFLLHEVFDYDYGEVASIVDRSEDNCRQIVSRAKKHVAGRRPRFDVNPARQQAILERFMMACQTGDLQALVTTLKDDITLYADGGGKVRAALKPIYGADRVSRFLIGVLSKFALSPAPEYRITVVNGQPGVASIWEGCLLNVTIFDLDDDAIRNIYIVSNPEKLPDQA